MFSFCTHCFLNLFDVKTLEIRSNRQIILWTHAQNCSEASHSPCVLKQNICKQNIGNLHSCTKTQHHTIRMSTVVYVIHCLVASTVRLQTPFATFGLRPHLGLLTCTVYGQFLALVQLSMQRFYIPIFWLMVPPDVAATTSPFLLLQNWWNDMQSLARGSKSSSPDITWETVSTSHKFKLMRCLRAHIIVQYMYIPQICPTHTHTYIYTHM